MLSTFFKNFSKDLNRVGHSISDTTLMNILKSPEQNDIAIGCCLLHGNNSNKSCQYAFLLQLYKWIVKIWKAYSIAHIIPIVLYKRKELRKNPLKVIKRFLWGFFKSHLWVQINGCFLLSFDYHILTGGGLLTVFRKFWLTLLATLSIFFESVGRIEEITIWIFPKFVEMTQNYFKKKNIIKKEVPGSLTLLYALSVGVLCEVHMAYGYEVKSKYNMIGRKIIGDELDISNVDL